MKNIRKLFKTFMVPGMSFFLFLMMLNPSAAQTWIELSPVGSPPDPIYMPKWVNYDATNNRLIAFFPGNPAIGGSGNQVWILTNANGLGGTSVWIPLEPTGTPPHSNGLESVVYDADTNRLIVYGGCWWHCSPALSEVFVLTNANGLGGTPGWSQSTVTNQQWRTHHSAVCDPTNNRMITFGGNLAFFGTDQNDTRVLTNANGVTSPSAWITLFPSGTLPPIRNQHTTIYDSVSNRMILYAGANYQENYCCGFPSGNMYNTYDDLWILTNANGLGGTPAWLLQTPPGAVPPSRMGHSAVYDPTQNRMIVFGGTSIIDFTEQTYTRLGDLWELNNANGLTGTPTWNQLSQIGTLPGPRTYHRAAFDSANQRMIVLGGRDPDDIPSNRVWILILPQTVPIDIKPGSFPNTINLGSKGNVPVAIFSTTVFDATTIDPITVTLAGASVKLKGKGTAMTSFEDVNGDGLQDIIVHVDTAALELSMGDTDAVLGGETYDGKKIRGTDTIRVIE